MASATSSPLCREDSTKSEQDFVTVVSVGSQPTNVENFVTVLSIGTEDKNDCQAVCERTAITNPLDIHPEEQVEVFRLPGEPLGFGLKFEGGAKNAEKVKRLFVQSCAEQSPASRAKCSWGTIGEGDEVLSIDGVPVTHMSRLDCVRRLKESQLVIKLLIRCRGALRPEVVSAERKSPAGVVAKSVKIPPELPSLPPPVPPRKLRQARGSADGEANPIPAKKTWNGSPKSNSGTSSLTDSPQSQSLHGSSPGSNGKSMLQETSNSIGNSSHGSPNESFKRTSNEASPEMTKSKQEPPEAMIYLDARSQDGSSTHGSTSDDTGSSMSTVVDRFSMSDRFSTVSTTSTTSGGAADQQGALDRSGEEHIDENRDFRENTLPPLEQLEQDFLTNSSDYLLKRLANSEAVTHVESRGEVGGVVEKITAVVAPNTVLIEETLTLQPPLSFQDAPLSYGHETRPDLVYAADLAGDSTTHFRPIRDEASIVECVNGENLQNGAPSLPARNHVNRIPVVQQKSSTEMHNVVQSSCQTLPKVKESLETVAPILPPKPMPRKDIKSKRKRLPPPPPPPRREPPPPVPLRGQIEPAVRSPTDVTIVEISNDESKNFCTLDNNKVSSNSVRQLELSNGNLTMKNGKDELNIGDNEETLSNYDHQQEFSPENSPTRMDYNSGKTNKVLEIIEMKKVKAFGESTPNRSPTMTNHEAGENDNYAVISPARRITEVVAAPREKKLTGIKREGTVSTEVEDSETSTGSISDNWHDAKERQDSSENGTISNNCRSGGGIPLSERPTGDDVPNVILGKEVDQPKSNSSDNDDDDETYRSLDEIKEDFKSSETNGILSSSDEDEEDAGSAAQREGDSTSEDSEDNGDDDYYWQSNLATIGEEEETSSMEYTIANKDVNILEDKSSSGKDERKIELRGSTIERNETMKNATATDVTKPAECVRRISKDSISALNKKLGTQVNAGRMENCGGDQRLPPDGDEFPAMYQEFSGCTSEQYQYVATSTRNTQPNNSTTSNSGRDCNEIDETSSSMSSTSSSFVEKGRNESMKLVRNDSITAKNTTNNNTTTSTAREKSSTYVRTTNIQQPVVESRIASQYIANSLKRETILVPEVAARSSSLPEDTNEKRRKNSCFGSSSSRVSKLSSNTEPIVVVSEKTFEIPEYYPKETKIMSDSNAPEYPENPPPPLPLTGPPKIENVAVPIGKNIVNATESNSQRKFSLSGDLWRQDDKSEKSVRDKIAMFSSQSSLESPLFPSQASPSLAATANVGNNGRRLSKYKSSEDVFCDEKIQETKEHYTTIERTRSSVDLTDSKKISAQNETTVVEEKYDSQRAPSLPKTLPPEESTVMRVTSYSTKTLTPPAVYQKPAHSMPENSIITSREFTSTEFNNTPRKNISVKPVVPLRTNNCSSLALTPKSTNDKDPLDVTQNSTRSTLPSLTRATSFSGESTYTSDLSQLTTSTITSTNGQISRTNSLASTVRRNSEDMRRQSLNQLIEQRKKGISKLRGLVIPEKNTVPIDKPIIDLPEIKSRDSILLHQVPKACIQDKWGSQSSIASNTSSVSSPLKATTSFKMPAPQIMSKYSPAFKRKSLAVYGSSSANSSAANTPPSTRRPSPTNNHSGIITDPPKSLESICSPTRSDYSFEYVSSTSISPDTGMRNRPRPGQRKIRGDYDDSDNDSAVSSSQSSISRGFSPSTSPAPSERSSISSERSYHTSLIMEMPSRNYSGKESANRSEKSQYLTSPGSYGDHRVYPSSERSSSGSSSGSSPNPRSPQPDTNPRNSHIPQRQMLKRSSSTETNCSSESSSTLTSGSQASAESLSRRVLKPQSVEAINRKNILASAKCRSGRDLNGSPLIQRKFSDDEELPVSGLAQENGNYNRTRQSNGNTINDNQDVKIAYIEITEILTEDEDSRTSTQVIVDESKESIKNINTTESSTNSDLLEASNDLKMWVRSEAKALMAEMPRPRISESTKVPLASKTTEPISPIRTTLDTRSKSNVTANSAQSLETRKMKSTSRGSINDESVVDSVNEDILTTLTTKSRSRAPINLEDRSFSRSSRQMSLEDILVGKAEPKLVRTESVTVDRGMEKSSSLQYLGSQTTKVPASTLPRNNAGRTSLKESWSEDKSFVSKIPTLGRANKGAADVDDCVKLNDRFKTSKIPTQRPLDRRSTSVTDMKKALDKTDSTSSFNVTSTSNNQSNNPITTGVHHRFSSLDSSVEERNRLVGHEPDTEKFNGEQFGSISSLASSTSLISQQELAQLVEEASSLEDVRGAHDVIVVLLHKENPHGSVGITLAGGVDCEAKEITVHRVLAHSVADKDGRVQRGDRILSINGRSTRGLSHRESLAVLKQPRSEVVLVVSRSRHEEGSRLRSRTDSVETIVEGSEACGTYDDTAWGPATKVAIFKDGAGLGFSLAGGRDSPLGDRPLIIKKIFTGGAAEKTATLKAGDQLLEVNGIDVTRMSRIEAWSLMKKLNDGETNLLVRHPATKSS